MTARVVETGDWVTFPLKQTNACTIEWSSNLETQSAVYYTDKCWFGVPFSPRDGNGQYTGKDLYKRGLRTRLGGNTIIFIAAEYVEERTAGAPHLSKKHVIDRMKAVKDSKKFEDVPENWAMLPINSHFHYGQTSDKKVRWLVYHPGLDGKTIYQHRFKENSKIAISKAGVKFVQWASKDVLDGIPKIGGFIKAGGQIISGLLELVIKYISVAVGHQLHPFEDPSPKQKIEGLQKDEESADPQQDKPIGVDLQELIRETFKLDNKFEAMAEVELLESEEPARPNYLPPVGTNQKKVSSRFPDMDKQAFADHQLSFPVAGRGWLDKIKKGTVGLRMGQPNQATDI